MQNRDAGLTFSCDSMAPRKYGREKWLAPPRIIITFCGRKKNLLGFWGLVLENFSFFQVYSLKAGSGSGVCHISATTLPQETRHGKLSATIYDRSLAGAYR